MYILPVYLLPLRDALICVGFFELWVAGTLDYLFFRGIGLRMLPALNGGLAYMFSGYMTLWLNWPLSGAAAFIPGCLLFVDQVVLQLAARRSAVWAMLGLFVCQVLGLLAGHPETTFFGVLLSAAYAAFRLYGLARQLSFRRAV